MHLLDSMPGKPPEQLVSLELEQANTQVSLSPNAATVFGTVQEVVLRDCCSSTSGSSEAMFFRWYQPGQLQHIHLSLTEDILQSHPTAWMQIPMALAGVLLNM